MSVVEEESNADEDSEEGIIYTLAHFEGVLLNWWARADLGRGNVTISDALIVRDVIGGFIFFLEKATIIITSDIVPLHPQYRPIFVDELILDP